MPNFFFLFWSHFPFKTIFRILRWRRLNRSKEIWYHLIYNNPCRWFQLYFNILNKVLFQIHTTSIIIMLLRLSTKLSHLPINNSIAILIAIIIHCLTIPTMFKFILIHIILKLSFLSIIRQLLLHLFQCMIIITPCFVITMVVMSLIAFHQTVKVAIIEDLKETLNHVMI